MKLTKEHIDNIICAVEDTLSRMAEDEYDRGWAVESAGPDEETMDFSFDEGIEVEIERGYYSTVTVEGELHAVLSIDRDEYGYSGLASTSCWAEISTATIWDGECDSHVDITHHLPHKISVCM